MRVKAVTPLWGTGTQPAAVLPDAITHGRRAEHTPHFVSARLPSAGSRGWPLSWRNQWRVHCLTSSWCWVERSLASNTAKPKHQPSPTAPRQQLYQTATALRGLGVGWASELQTKPQVCCRTLCRSLPSSDRHREHYSACFLGKRPLTPEQTLKIPRQQNKNCVKAKPPLLRSLCEQP